MTLGLRPPNDRIGVGDAGKGIEPRQTGTERTAGSSAAKSEAERRRPAAIPGWPESGSEIERPALEFLRSCLALVKSSPADDDRSLSARLETHADRDRPGISSRDILMRDLAGPNGYLRSLKTRDLSELVNKLTGLDIDGAFLDRYKDAPKAMAKLLIGVWNARSRPVSGDESRGPRLRVPIRRVHEVENKRAGKRAK